MSTELQNTHTEFSPANKVYTVGEVADAMRVSKMSIYRLIHAGSLQSLKVRGSFRVTQAALDAYLAHADYAPTEAQ